LVEVTDGRDSSGGLSSRDPMSIMLYANVRLALTDFNVVNTMNDYF